MKTLPAFNKKYPDVKINIFEGTSAAIDKKLLDGDIDLAFYSKPPKENQNDHITYETITAEELLICTCENHSVKILADEKNHTRNFPLLSSEK